ncbi:MAG: hypothetical protein F4Z58_09705 [Acidimicrobiaceae bacterium]|nr:hypothetical protein [Acidimicrobiaceae bacterium]MXW76296.1 hypothetical protein [Acidimicrobiaceae bacterium]MYC42983.1 hypothetical protein [Acidimicrobiaceae bacterium]MYD07525.1 hypothetical protein [Acidimicrobiaceae bacterium]MYI58195.1 hypothetical protein [Acidimicrobiaceae bacterium]
MGDSDLEKWLEEVSTMPQYRSAGDKRAPYKPLLLLWIIGRLSNGGDSEIRFKDAESELKELLGEFGVGRTAPRPEHPFVYLASSPKLWQVTDEAGNDIFKMSEPLNDSMSAPARETVSFLRDKATGRVPEPFMNAINDAPTRDQIVRHLLNAEFPETTHEDILGRVGLHLGKTLSDKRDAAFRETVLLAYEQRCSFCDFAVFLQGKSVSIDAAHLKMHAKKGPSVIENGIALCALHHRLFDLGAIGLTTKNDEHKILVSQRVSVLNDSSRHLLDLSLKPMRLPQAGYSPPAEEYIDWHYENLFKQPARQ